MNKRIIKIGRNILFMLSVPLIVSAFVFADVSTRHEICQGVHITFSNDALSFVTRQHILDVLQAKHIVAHKTPLRNIQIRDLEHSIEENKWVSRADIFAAADNQLYIRIEQKKPVVRIQPGNEWEEPFYLDAYGNSVPYAEHYVPDLPVVSSPEIAYYTEDRALKLDIVKLARFLADDTFWNAAITQISIDSNKTFSLVPAFGTQLIILGNVENLDQKMSKLFQFYKQGYRTVRWDKYDEIDLRFERQVVCRNTRGENISVDPYDKSTHKDIMIADADKHTDKAATAEQPVASPATVVQHTSKPISTQTVKSATSHEAVANAPAAKINAGKKTSTAFTHSDKQASKEKKVAAVQTKTIEKQKPVAKNEPKESNKTKSSTHESKPAMTEVVNSKYFKQQ